VEEEDDAHQPDNDAFLDQRAIEGPDGTVDQLGAIVRRDHLNPGRQGRRQLGDLRLHPGHHIERVGPDAHDHDPSDGIAFAVPLRHTDPEVCAQGLLRDITHPDGPPSSTRTDGDIDDVFNTPEIAQSPNGIVAPSQLDRTSANVAVGRADGIRHHHWRHSVRLQPHRIEQHLVLPNHAADAGDFGYPSEPLERIPDLEILNAPELRLRVALALQGILVDPAHPGGIWSQLHPRIGRKARLDRVKALQDP
jgi:hypothetical protein